uniref:STI1 domain-containing protein n=4 Tax=Ditylum brightwellii TaxID=49249 RepID=A0A7S4W9J5_9STRA
MSSAAMENSGALKKTPKNVSEAIKKLPASEQVVVQTYIAKLKSAIEDLEHELLRHEDDGDEHAHYHGHEKCTHDHGHSHDHGKEEKEASPSGHAHDHGHETCKEDHNHEHGHGHEDKHGHDHEHEHEHKHEHEHEHEHAHDHKKDEKDDIPEWKKKAMAMDNDPMAAPFGGSWNMESSMDATTGTSGKVSETSTDTKDDLPPLYVSGDDFEKASNLKMEASDLKSAGDYKAALDKYSQAVLAAEPSALLYANRADVLLKLKRYEACIRDCNEALKKNPDSAKALRIRGKANKMTGSLRESLKDLSSSQSIDYDDEAAEILKEVSKQVQEMDHEVVMKKVQEEEKLKKRAEEIKKAREEAEKEARERSASAAAAGSGGMPGMSGGVPGMGGAGGPGSSMPGGMGGLMSVLLSDPELAAGMQNPKVMAAFQELMSSPGGAMGLMSDPSKLQKLMADPEVGPFLQKLMAKLGPMMGGMMGGAGGMPPGGMGGGAGMDEDMPDLDDIPDLG